LLPPLTVQTPRVSKLLVLMLPVKKSRQSARA
jgi:hypothetical protein